MPNREMTDLEYETLLNTPRGIDVSKYNTTTIGTNYTKMNEITPSTDKVLYVYGVNWVPRADVTKIELFIDGTTTGAFSAKKEYDKGMSPPGPKLQPVITFRPPLKASTGVYLKGKAGTAQNNFQSWIGAFEADQ